MDPHNSPIDYQSEQYRRGQVLGFTMAEIMLVLLFILLLMLGRKINQLEKDLVHAIPAETPKHQAATLVEAVLVDLKESGAATPKEDEYSLTKKLILVAEEAARRETPEGPLSMDEARSEIAQLQDELAKRDGQIKRLVEASVPGDIPFCTYDGKAVREGALRGQSISVGTFLIEPDGITLLQRNQRFFEGGIVDYNGLDYDNAAAAAAIRDWPLGLKQDLASFAARGQEFIEIGDIETETHKKCRFGGLYYYETNDENLKVFNTVFQNYFFLGARERVSRGEVERLLRQVRAIEGS